MLTDNTGVQQVANRPVEIPQGGGPGNDVKSSDGHQILLASGCNKPKSEARPEQSHTCQTRPIWSPWGWAVHRRRLVWLIANWCSRKKKCFTCRFRAHYRRTRRELFPMLSRIQNIGYELGDNSRTAEWYHANHRTPWVATMESQVPYSLMSPLPGEA